jgi:hypothetical protein
MQQQDMPPDDNRLMSNQLLGLIFPRSKRFTPVLFEHGAWPSPASDEACQAYTVLVPGQTRNWRDRARFSAIAGRPMLWRLIDMRCRRLVP